MVDFHLQALKCFGQEDVAKFSKRCLAELDSPRSLAGNMGVKMTKRRFYPARPFHLKVDVQNVSYHLEITTVYLLITDISMNIRRFVVMMKLMNLRDSKISYVLKSIYTGTHGNATIKLYLSLDVQLYIKADYGTKS